MVFKLKKPIRRLDIMIIEDDPSFQIMYRDIFSCIKSNIICMEHSGINAIKKYEALKIKPDLIIVDFRLSDDINGIEVIRCLLERGCSSKILMVSGHPELKEVIGTLKIDYVLEKPFSIKDLLKILSEI